MYSRKKLLALAKERGFVGTSHLTKEKLVNLLTEGRSRSRSRSRSRRSRSRRMRQNSKCTVYVTNTCPTCPSENMQRITPYAEAPRASSPRTSLYASAYSPASSRNSSYASAYTSPRVSQVPRLGSAESQGIGRYF